MIKPFNFPKLRNNEFSQFMNDIISRCLRYNGEELKINDAVNQVQNTSDLLIDVYNKDTRSEVTEKLTISDGLRDNDLVGIRTVAEGFTYSRRPEIAEAAKSIVESIDRHGKSISRMNYQAESTVIEAITNDWETNTKLKVALELLKLSDWAKTLKAENETFKQVYQLRVDDKLENSGDSFTELRASVFGAYKNLCDTIFAHWVISKNPQYQKLADAINLIIDDYQSLIDRRESTKEKQEAE